MKNIIYFLNNVFYVILLFLCVIGFIGGVGCACMIGQYVTAIGIIALATVAMDNIVKIFKRIIS